jgi:hypothetical protein
VAQPAADGGGLEHDLVAVADDEHIFAMLQQLQK